MKLHAFDIPSSPEELATWLEDQLVGLHLGELVAELLAVRELPTQSEPSLNEVLGTDLPRVLQSGLTVIPQTTLRRLLQHPRCLLALQEHLLVDGGAYWVGIEQRVEGLKSQLDRNWQLVSSSLQGNDLPATSGHGNRLATDTDGALVNQRRTNRNWLTPLLATVAALVAGFFLGDRFGPGSQPIPTGWGWQKPGVFQLQASQPDYLNHLADSADEWFKKRPETAIGLAQRITEFRSGCTALLLAEHRPLTDETRRWLRERCSLWAGKLDTHRNDLEAGKNVIDVRKAADETVQKLIQALRTKAAEVVS